MENLELYKWFIKQGPIMETSIWSVYLGINSLVSSLVFLFKNSERFLDISLGFTGGVMIAAWLLVLIITSTAYVEMQNEIGLSSIPSWIPPAIGFFLGAFISLRFR